MPMKVFHLMRNGGSVSVRETDFDHVKFRACEYAKQTGATVRVYDSQLKELGWTVFNKALGVWQFEEA
jgi:hypothetical protein